MVRLYAITLIGSMIGAAIGVALFGAALEHRRTQRPICLKEDPKKMTLDGHPPQYATLH